VKRTDLSSKLIIEKTIFFLLLATVLTFCAAHYPELLFIAVPVFIFLDYLVYYLPDKIEFDNEHLFIKRKTGEECIDLKHICLVKMTGLSIGRKNIWKIKYSNYNGDGIVRFYPGNVSSFNDFIKLVRAANSNVEVRTR